jgi:alkylhydroperoxidase family enzyme
MVPATPVPPDLRAEIKKRIGVLPPWLPLLAPVPWLARAQCIFRRAPAKHVPRMLLGLVHLVVTQDNSCRYCYSEYRAAMMILGYREDAIDELERSLDMSLPPDQMRALEVARKLSRANPRPGREDLQALLATGFSREAVPELLFQAAGTCFRNRVATLLAFPVGELEQKMHRPLMRLVRPLLARMVTRPPMSEGRRDLDRQPFAEIVRAFGDIACAHSLRRVIDDAWESAALSRRTKALMFGVTARASGCEVVAGESLRILVAEGLDAAQANEILAHLGGSGLEEREAQLASFARETVRYQPAPIQERVAALARMLSPVELLETVGIAALANTVCRLSVLVGC